jgi:acetolactate decarboxylase
MVIEEKFVSFLHVLQRQRGQSGGRHGRVEESEHQQAHEIYQTSTINALLEGVYDGAVTFGELRQHGDFGLGTFNGLDGEMIALDGEFYQIRSDGLARPVDDDQKTPFAVVQFFRPEFKQALDDELDFDQLKEELQQHHRSVNFFYAVRIDGLFSYLKTRSVPRQHRPYPALVEVAKEQPVFEFYDMEGTLAGFRFPDYAAGMNVPGYHLHFITRDRTAGGHVLDLRLKQGTLSVEHTANFHMELPESGGFLEADLAKDQRDAIHQAESDK